MTEHTDNRPERCGAMRAALADLEISAQSALDHYTSIDLLRSALAEIARNARAAVADDDGMKDAAKAAFEARMTAQAARGQPGTDDRCAVCRRSAHRPGLLAHGHHGHDYVAPHDEGTTYCTNVPGGCPVHPEPVSMDAARAEILADVPEPEPIPGDNIVHDCDGPGPCHCGVDAPDAPDADTYPARMSVLRASDRDQPDSPFVYLCHEPHGSGCPGWQSIEYATPYGAADAARDHARAVHGMAPPAALAQILAAGE